jgi:hypothetical protein
MAMTPEKERGLVERMLDAFYPAGCAELSMRTDEDNMRAALSIAAPILRNEALEEGAGAVERLIDTDKIRRECCGNGVQSAYDEPPECCGDPDLMVTIGDAASAIRSLKTKDKPE